MYSARQGIVSSDSVTLVKGGSFKNSYLTWIMSDPPTGNLNSDVTS